MKVELTNATIDRIAERVVVLLKGAPKKKEAGYVTTREAASILQISSDRMRRLKDKFPHVKAGDSEQGQLLFLKEALIKSV